MLLRKFILFLIPLIAISTVRAQGDLAPKYSNDFLSIGVDARALGMSNSVVAGVDDVTAGYWNPAGLVQMPTMLDFGLMHAEYFAGISKYDYIGAAYKIDDKSAVGFTGIRFGVDNIPNTTQLIDADGNVNYDNITTFTAADYGFLLTYSRELSVPRLYVGGNVKIIYRQVGDFANSWGFGIDAGVQYHLKKNWKFGAVLRDATSTFNAWVFKLDDVTKDVWLQTGNELPENGLELTLPRLILGAQGDFEFGKGFYGLFEMDFDFTFDGRRNVLIRTSPISIDPHLGVEVGWKEYVALRAGFGNFQFEKQFDGSEKLSFQPNIGIGIGFKGVRIDYAFTDIGNQSVALYSHIFSLKFRIKGKRDKKGKEKESNPKNE